MNIENVREIQSNNADDGLSLDNHMVINVNDGYRYNLKPAIFLDVAVKPEDSRRICGKSYLIGNLLEQYIRVQISELLR